MNDNVMHYPQPAKCARVRVRGVRHDDGSRLYIRTNRTMKDELARSVRGDGSMELSRRDLSAGAPVDIS